MDEDGEAQKHLELSREYLAVASAALQAGALAPARFNSVHALELAVKAVLAGALGSVPKTHNIGGEFGRHFREVVGAEVARRVNRILHDYDAPRYPDWEAPGEDVIRDDIAFVSEFLRETAPVLLGGPRP